MHEYAGVIHVHSNYSDGSGTVPDIIDAGRSAGIDFLVLTDHNSLGAAEDGFAGWHKDLLLVVGEEVSARSGHCLAIGTTRQVSHRQPAKDIIGGIREQGGLSILAHPHGIYRPVIKRRDHSWKDWSVHSFTGIELWSYMFDWASRFHYTRFFKHYRNPDAWIRGPFAQTLRTWDRLCRSSRVVAIGGVDAHARRYPPFPFVVFPYDRLFQTVRTHVLTYDPLSGEDRSRDTQNLLQAIGAGSCYVSWDGLSDAAGFRFFATCEDSGAIAMGEETPYSRPVTFRVQLPRSADIAVLRDGHPYHRHRGNSHSFTAHGPGVYRIEAHLSGIPWIYSNPIYLRV